MNTGMPPCKEEGVAERAGGKKFSHEMPRGLHKEQVTPSVICSSIQDGWQSGRSRTLGKRVYLYR